MPHLEEGTIHAWLDGALKLDEATDVEQHVAGCATCSAAVAEARGFIAASSRILSALDDVPAIAKRDAPGAPTSIGARRATARPRSRVPLYAMAATLFLAIGTVTIARQMSRGDSVASMVAADSGVQGLAQPAAPSPSRDVAAESSSPMAAPPVAPTRAEPRATLERRDAPQAARSVAPMQKKAAQERQEAANIAVDRSATPARPDPVVAAAPPPPSAAGAARSRERDGSAAMDSLVRAQTAKMEQVAGAGTVATVSRAMGATLGRTLVATPAEVQGFAAGSRNAQYAGCYVVARVDDEERKQSVSNDARVLPMRLDLDSAGSSLTDRARASARPAGPADSLGAVSAAWRQVARNQVEVRWSLADGSAFVLVAEDSGGILRGTVTSSGRPFFTARVELRRARCS